MELGDTIMPSEENDVNNMRLRYMFNYIILMGLHVALSSKLNEDSVEAGKKLRRYACDRLQIQRAKQRMKRVCSRTTVTAMLAALKQNDTLTYVQYSK